MKWLYLEKKKKILTCVFFFVVSFDAEQNMRLRFIEKDMQMIEAHVDTLRIRSVQQEELHNPPHPFLPVVEHPKKTEAGGVR